jgi:hypothetical protein
VSKSKVRDESAMAHYLFNFSRRDVFEGSAIRDQAAELLRARIWEVAADEPHRSALAPGDLALIYLGAPLREFIGRAELASAVREWTPSEAQVYPGELSSGVVLGHVEEWDTPVPMSVVLPRIDPTGSNPYVQANAKAGFQTGVIRITAHEYETAVAISREARGS